MLARIAPWLAGLTLLLPSCSKPDDDKDNDNDPPPSSWLVGAEGEMLRLTATEEGEEVATYPLRHRGDLEAIACTGRATAWVAGEDGALLVSRDAGESWSAVEQDLHVDFRDIAVAEGSLEGEETVWVAGLDGVLLRSIDGGQQWSTVQGPALDWTAVSTDHAGVVALVTALDGSVWRSDDGGALQQLREGDGAALYDIAVGHDDSTVVAVGEGGLVLRGDLEGTDWVVIDAQTARDLRAVHLSSDAQHIVAVGEAGVTVHIDDGRIRVQEILDAERSLFDLHLRADGVGQAVGSAGTVLLTEDFGLHFQAVDTGRDRDLRGVDDFHAAPHL